jgi:DNA-binding response OmpR family regulator
MQDETLRILLIEDNPGDERLVREALRDFPGIQVISAYRLESGVARLAAEKVDEILLDLSLPDSQGLDSVRTVRRNGIDAAIVVLTGLDDEETAIKALQAGAQDYMAKNQLNPRLLAHTLRYAVERKRLDDRIYFQATHDDLTGLPNRALFRDRLQNALARAERMKDEARGQPLAAVLLLDLDHFKTVNDTRGHAAGGRGAAGRGAAPAGNPAQGGYHRPAGRRRICDSRRRICRRRRCGGGRAKNPPGPGQAHSGARGGVPDRHQHRHQSVSRRRRRRRGAVQARRYRALSRKGTAQPLRILRPGRLTRGDRRIPGIRILSVIGKPAARHAAGSIPLMRPERGSL